MTERDISALGSLLNQQTNRERQLMLPGVDADLVTGFFAVGYSSVTREKLKARGCVSVKKRVFSGCMQGRVGSLVCANSV
jgi:hypothetical protein